MASYSIVICVKITMLLFIANYSESANILYIIPLSLKSHYINLRPIGLELAHRGHNVTVITTHLEKNPPSNYHQVKVPNKGNWDILGTGRPNSFTAGDFSAENFHNFIVWPASFAFTDEILNEPEIKEFLKKDNFFDLVISEQFILEALNVIAFKYNAPLALISTFGNCMRQNVAMRNPLQLATVVSEYLDLENPESFWGRLRNFYFTAYEYYWWRYWYLEKQEQLVRKHFPELVGKSPSLYDLQKDASIMLVNSHFSYDNPMALLPNIIEIGGVHLAQNANISLPKDLQKILDESEHGVVYVSFGSNIKSTELPEDKKKTFINVFKKLKQTVIWKWEEDELEGKPQNLVIRKWLPQNEILAHPNVKVFIAHGGLIGLQEAIFNGVPVIGIPVYADQFNNILYAERAGVGKLLKFKDVNEKSLERCLNDVLNDDSYLENARKLQIRWKDRPMNPLDTAVFWLEYVIRNKGAEHIKNPARNMNWVAYSMLDVYAYILAIFLVVIIIFVKIITTVIRVSFSSSIKTTYRKKQS